MNVETFLNLQLLLSFNVTLFYEFVFWGCKQRNFNA